MSRAYARLHCSVPHAEGHWYEPNMTEGRREPEEVLFDAASASALPLERQHDSCSYISYITTTNKMPGAHSKELAALQQAAFAQAFSVFIYGQATPVLVKRLLQKAEGGGVGAAAPSAADVAAFLGTLGSSAALVEFLLNPVLGGLQDARGRKPFMLIAPVVVSCLNGLMVLTKGRSRAVFLASNVLNW